MNLAAALYLTLKLTARISTFVIFSLWLEVNSVGDRLIHRAGVFVSGVFWRAVEALLT
jgi:hypothetical protein